MGRDGRAWLVRVLHYEVELELDPLLLILQNDDAPGMVGRIGNLLGEHGVNISNMRLSRSGPGGDAMMVLSLDARAVARGARRARGDAGRARSALADPAPLDVAPEEVVRRGHHRLTAIGAS